MYHAERLNFINKYINDFSFIPLKAESGRMKEPALCGWEKYCEIKSDFAPDQLAENNYGIATGPASNLIGIDVDEPEIFASFLRRKGFSINEFFAVKSGKGRHIYLKFPNDGYKYGNRKFGALGFDIRGIGGQVVGPFSYHEGTDSYYEPLSEGKITDPPEWLKDYCLNKTGSNKPKLDKINNKKIVDYIELGAENGSRSEASFSVVMSLLSYEFNDDQIFYVFNKFKIGEKYREKPEMLRDGWLQGEIDRARKSMAESIKDVNVPDATNIPEITYLNGSDLLKKECNVVWLVDNFIEKGGHTLITGRSGVGKSLFSLNLALTLASAPSEGFLGHAIPKPRVHPKFMANKQPLV